MRPVLLLPNPVQHFYRGGDRIAALRGIVAETEYQPEEWLGATVTRFGTSGYCVPGDPVHQVPQGSRRALPSSSG